MEPGQPRLGQHMGAVSGAVNVDAVASNGPGSCQPWPICLGWVPRKTSNGGEPGLSPQTFDVFLGPLRILVQIRAGEEREAGDSGGLEGEIGRVGAREQRDEQREARAQRM